MLVKDRRQTALSHQHTTDLVVRARQVALPSVIVWVWVRFGCGLCDRHRWLVGQRHLVGIERVAAFGVLTRPMACIDLSARALPQRIYIVSKGSLQLGRPLLKFLQGVGLAARVFLDRQQLADACHVRRHPRVLRSQSCHSRIADTILSRQAVRRSRPAREFGKNRSVARATSCINWSK